MNTRTVDWTDELGRRFRSIIPMDAPDREAPHGILLGPPRLEALGLPLDAEIRLNHQLWHRGLITQQDLERHIGDVRDAVLAAFRVDAQRILALASTDGNPP